MPYQCQVITQTNHSVHFKHAPDISEPEGGACGVLNGTERQQHRVWDLQGVTGNDGTEAYLEAAIFTMKLDAVLILTLCQIVRQTQGRGEDHRNNMCFLCNFLESRFMKSNGTKSLIMSWSMSSHQPKLNSIISNEAENHLFEKA